MMEDQRREDILMPRESAQLISSQSKDVFLSDEAISKASETIFQCLKSNSYSFKTWKEHELHPQEMTKETVDWIFLLDTLNFSFWVEDDLEPWTVRHDGKNHCGYWALCAGINRALKDNIPITKPSYYATITAQQLSHIFRSETSTEMPLLEERAKNLNEVGTILSQEFYNSFVNIIGKSGKSAKKLLQMVTSTFKCFQDEGEFNGRQVSFFKRAQILIADIWACFEGKSWGEFIDIEFLTMFADYKVPQALLYLGIMQYSEELTRKVKLGEIIPHGDRLELEIRGNSIWAIEQIYQVLKAMAEGNKEFSVLDDARIAQHLNSVIIDFYLWDFAKEKVEAITTMPCHKTRTIFY